MFVEIGDVSAIPFEEEAKKVQTSACTTGTILHAVALLAQYIWRTSKRFLIRCPIKKQKVAAFVLAGMIFSKEIKGMREVLAMLCE